VAEKSARLWTAGEDERVRQMVAAGSSLSDVAIALSRSEKAVKSRAYTLRLSLKRIGVVRRGVLRRG
jgi:hypothetical protein